MSQEEDDLGNIWIPIISAYALIFLFLNMAYVIYEGIVITRRVNSQLVNEKSLTTLPVIKWPLEPEHPLSYHCTNKTKTSGSKTSGSKRSGDKRVSGSTRKKTSGTKPKRSSGQTDKTQNTKSK
ncbi:unnamed protein product [Bursaphelenchus okinawaensis]|uniref:Uncharacterized protein n=1 Tax=Bursaphelenchus okinawaensis TaxID=465554 RepID=A0A811JUB6_9BILA|nr:unnamed protein product [Bursaphelenchus okinawaensis]CAG9083926.1 unnamed protein product [Bursaphelenchus okinawaensis]